MYNQEIKERFFNECTSLGKEKGNYRTIMDAIGEYEEKIQRDLAEMQVEDAIEALRYADIGVYNSATSAQSMIKNYVTWCYENKVFDHVNNNLLLIKISDIDVSRYLARTLFKDEDELISEMQTVRRFDEGFTEGLILLFAWLGIEQKDALTIKIEDVNLKDRVIFARVYGKYIHFSEKIADVFKIYEKTKEGFRSAGGSFRPVYRDDSYDTYIRKYSPYSQLGEKPLTPARIRSSVGVISKLYVAQGKESRLWNGNVVASGALHRVYLLERSGVNVFSKKNKEAVIEAFAVKSKLHEILWMYKNYKKAFNL